MRQFARGALTALALATALPAHAADDADKGDWWIMVINRQSMIAVDADVQKLGMSGAAMGLLIVQPDPPPTGQRVVIAKFEIDCTSNHWREIAEGGLNNMDEDPVYTTGKPGDWEDMQDVEWQKSLRAGFS